MAIRRIEENEKAINAAEVEAIQADLIECNKLLMKYEETEDEKDLDRIYEIIGEMLARGFEF